MIQCPKCSAENDDEAVYCDQCATGLSPETLGKTHDAPCPACGGEVREVPSVLSVCQACGLSLGEAAAESGCCGPSVPPSPAAAEPKAAPAKKPEKAETWDCPICALDNPVDEPRCGDCGIVFKKSYERVPCPRCKAEAAGDKCDCGTVLTLSKLVQFLDSSVKWVCPTCKALFSLDLKDEKCPDCGDTVEPADDLKSYAASLKK